MALQVSQISESFSVEMLVSRTPGRVVPNIKRGVNIARYFMSLIYPARQVVELLLIQESGRDPLRQFRLLLPPSASAKSQPGRETAYKSPSNL
jgi:hypothetical protein